MTTAPETGGNPQKSIMKTLAGIAAIILVVLATLLALKAFVLKGGPGTSGHPVSGASSQPGGGVELTEGALVPDFSLSRFGGGETRLSEFKEKVLLLNFWATWCEACVKEMPGIVALRKAYHDKGFEVIPVSVDENPDAVLPEVLKQFGIDFSVYVDNGQKLSDLFDVHGIPLSVVMNKDRKILFVESGERDWDGEKTRSQLDRWLTQ